MKPETVKKTAEALLKLGLAESRVEVPADFIKWSIFTNEVREGLMGGWLPIRYASEDEGKTWKGGFPMMGVTNASGTKKQTVGYITETAGDWKTRTDHLSLSFGRQLLNDVPELLASVDESPTSLAVENVELKSQNDALKIGATVMDMLYDDDFEGERKITPEIWAMIPQKLQIKAMAVRPEIVDETILTYADGNAIEREAPAAPKKK